MYAEYLIFVYVTLVVHHAKALPNGAPTSACSTFMPRHVNRQSGGFLSSQSLVASPYSIVVSRTNFTRNTVIRVHISDNRTTLNGYRGILLQARLNDSFSNGTQGSWMNPPQFTKLIRCNNRNDAVTHSEVINVKNETTVFEWRAPCDRDIGNVVFIATVAQTRELFWPRITSDVVMEVSNVGSGQGPTQADECGENEASVTYVSILSCILTILTALSIS
uniref:putative defense protein 3 n=1 Tax=Styela clava TaxID=7725 RepID=UPI001939D8A5|nr:putative defense protein 3 [Styela clava]